MVSNVNKKVTNTNADHIENSHFSKTWQPSIYNLESKQLNHYQQEDIEVLTVFSDELTDSETVHSLCCVYYLLSAALLIFCLG